MTRVKSLALSLLLVLSILINLVQIVPAFSSSGMVRELLVDEKRELYVDSVVSSEIPDSEEKKISITGICKNLQPEPSSCVDIFFFSLVDSSGKEYPPQITESSILPPRLPVRDVLQGTLTFVIPKSENATQLIYNEPDTNFIIDLSSTKNPTDKPPVSEWKLTRLKGVTLSDSRVELKIYSEVLDNGRYILDISILNKGRGVVDYNLLYAYLKSPSGFLFAADPFSDVEPKIDSGALQPGGLVRGKIAFDVGGQSGSFMLIYDDIAGSYLSSGKFAPRPIPVTGRIIGSDDLIKITEYNTYSDPVSGAYKILGEVSNDSGDFVSNIRIHGVLKDKLGLVMAELDRTLTNFQSSAPTMLAPNTKIPFFLEFETDKASTKNIGSYELSLQYTVSEAKDAVLLINEAELIQVSKPTPLSKNILWQIKGSLVNNGDERSTHTHLIVSLYDSKGTIIGVGGFSVLDQQPKDMNPNRIEPFTIEISLPTTFKPTSFYIYADSRQFVIQEPKIDETVEGGEGEEKELELEGPESLPPQIENHTLVNIKSKQRGDLLDLVIKNSPNSTGNIYSVQVYINGTTLDALKTKLRWDSEKNGNNELLLHTANNPIKPGQTGRFLFNAADDVPLIVWRAYDLDDKVLVDSEVKPFQIRFG
ncbi:MAG: hypothetical protein ACE5KA_07575 [Nitrososphaerales archaeon]